MKTRTHGHLVNIVAVCAIFFALAGCAAAPPAREAGPPRADGVDLTAIHTPGSTQFRGECLTCHADIMKRPTLKPGIKEAHAAMIPFLPDFDAKVGVTNNACRSCHTKVDVVQHSGVQIRRNSDPTSCAACHGKNGAATKKFYAE
jgi:decaheme cytochrome c component MtrC/MtrF-like protein